MKKILRGAIVPAFAVAIIQFMIEFMFPIAAFAQGFEDQLRLAFVMMAFSQTALLIGASIHARRLRRRGASFSTCVVGGAAVGLLANLASQIAKSVLLGLGLGLAVMASQAPGVDSTVFTVIVLVMAVSCLNAAIGGLIVGEIGGGLAGIVSTWGTRKARSRSVYNG